jgi:hypothetical protein
MSHFEDAIARLLQIRRRLAPITERLLDIETRLTAAKPADIERPVKISLREFSSKLLGEIQHHSPRAARDIEKFRAVLRSSVK